MTILLIKAYVWLIRFDFHLARGNFAVIHDLVRTCRLTNPAASISTVSQVCSAVDLACIWYWKEVLCLQRSATTVCLLRTSGVAAEMVIGARQLPFKAHAWVEVDGRVVNDKPYVPETYAVLDRC